MARARYINLDGVAIDLGATPSSTTPAMNGTAAVGTETSFARGDHIHPTDTSRQATITGAASTVTSSNLTASRVLISNSSGKIAADSNVTTTELGYLDGVTSSIQTQLNNKLNKTLTSKSVALMTDGNGDIVASQTTAAQLEALRTLDTTSTIQTQIDGKAPTNHQSTGTSYGVGTALAYGHLKIANNVTTSSFDADAPVALSAYQGKVLNDGLSGKAPTNHLSSSTDYGVGSGTQYGHCKTINNITTASYSAGEALAAYQGKVLDDKITAITPSMPSLNVVGKSNQSVTSATDTNMGSFTLSKGLWLVTITARWNANATGIRQVWLASSSTGAALNYGSVVSHQAVNGAITSEQLTVFLNVSASTTYYIVVRQSSGSALTCNTSYSTCRLGDV